MSMEDVATGLIAESCNVACSSEDWDGCSGPDRGADTPVVALHLQRYKTARITG